MSIGLNLNHTSNTEIYYPSLVAGQRHHMLTLAEGFDGSYSFHCDYLMQCSSHYLYSTKKDEANSLALALVAESQAFPFQHLPHLLSAGAVSLCS